MHQKVIVAAVEVDLRSVFFVLYQLLYLRGRVRQLLFLSMLALIRTTVEGWKVEFSAHFLVELDSRGIPRE